MPFRKMNWPKFEEKLKLEVGGICRGDAIPQCTDPVPPMSNSWCCPWWGNNQNIPLRASSMSCKLHCGHEGVSDFNFEQNTA